MLKVNEALNNLQRALEECGLGEVTLVINCHNLTPCQSKLKARELALGGFGTRMVEEDKVHRYSHKQGGFSWVQLEEAGTKINLFYDLNPLITS